MVKGSYRRSASRTARSTTPPPLRIKRFRAISWYGDPFTKSVGDYVSHLLLELGRLGLQVRDIERHDRPPHTDTVLSDLLDWLSDRPGKAFANLFDWMTLDLEQMRSRLQKDRSVKPRIEVSAHITKMNNLSVRWHPGGWRHTVFDWERSDRNHFNLVTHQKWSQPPDFRWFEGDEDPTFDSRPSNELMYIRGVGNLRPEFPDQYGPYATYNHDVVDSILICAVRSAYAALIAQLARSFEIEIVHAFDFVIRDEIDEADSSPYKIPVHRVVAWSIKDAAELRARREREAAIEQDRQDRAELANVTEVHGFTLEALVGALLRASLPKRTGPAPSGEHTNAYAAKELRKGGSKVNAGDVHRLRRLIERYNPEILPEGLRPSAPIPPVNSPSSNVVQFSDSDGNEL